MTAIAAPQDLVSAVTAEDRSPAEILDSINLRIRVAHYLADFMAENARALAYATVNGCPIVDLYANPNGRERGNRIAAYPTSVTLSTVERHRAKIAQLGTLAGRIGIRSTESAEALAKVETAVSEAVRRLRGLDLRLSAVFVDGNGKSYLSGIEQAALDVEQFSWSSTEKNVSAATDIRHNASAQRWTRNDRKATSYIGQTGSLDDDALASAIAEADAAGGRLY